jgi:CBS domain-containing protein
MHAQEIMTQHVVTIGADATVVEALDTMLRHHVSGLPVVDVAGELIGIVSEGDFIRRAEIGTERKRGRWLAFLAGPDRIAAEFVHQHGRTVGEIMTADPITVTEDTPLDRIVQIMETSHVKRVPVVRRNRLVGIVTRSDFLPAVADLDRHAPRRSVDDDRIREGVIAAIGQAAWRPCRLKVTARGGIVSLGGVTRTDNARQAAIVAAENVAGVRKVLDNFCDARDYPPPEEDLGGGDFVSLQQQPSTADDAPL